MPRISERGASSHAPAALRYVRHEVGPREDAMTRSRGLASLLAAGALAVGGGAAYAATQGHSAAPAKVQPAVARSHAKQHAARTLFDAPRHCHHQGTSA